MSDSTAYIILAAFVVIFAAIWIPLMAKVHHSDKSADKAGGGSNPFVHLGEADSDTISNADGGSAADSGGSVSGGGDGGGG